MIQILKNAENIDSYFLTAQGLRMAELLRKKIHGLTLKNK